MGGQDFLENGMVCAIAGGRGIPQLGRQAVGDLHGDALRRIEAEELKTDRGLIGSRMEAHLAGRAQCQAVGSRVAPFPSRGKVVAQSCSGLALPLPEARHLASSWAVE